MLHDQACIPSTLLQDPAIATTNQRNANNTDSGSSGGAGPLVDPVLLARECLRDRDCRAFSNSGWRGAAALPAVASDRPGSCLYVYQEGEDTCGRSGNVTGLCRLTPTRESNIADEVTPPAIH